MKKCEVFENFLINNVHLTCTDSTIHLGYTGQNLYLSDWPLRRMLWYVKLAYGPLDPGYMYTKIASEHMNFEHEVKNC